MFPEIMSSRAALLRGLGLMLGATALAAGAVWMAAEGRAEAGLPQIDPWASAVLSGLLVAALAAALGWPVLRRAERLAIDHLRTAEELEQQRATDPPTGLPNGRAFDGLLERSLAVGRRHDYQVGLLLLHVGGWQRSSLRLGVEAADDILREIAALIARNLRAADTIARIGSEHLAVAIGNVESRESLVTLAERIVAKVEKVAAHHAEADLSSAIGIALASPAEAIEARALVCRAGQALAEADAGAGAPWRLLSGPDRSEGGRLSVVR